MINFFRKIRKKMADDNKFIKYLSYAIGEIVLVVIGILIALQINNWNKNKKQEILEIQFLISIKKDLISDTIYFNRRIRESKILINNHYQYIHIAYEEQKNIKEFQELINHIIWNSEHFSYQNSTFLELLNSGQLGIFKNNKLKEDIISLYKDYDIAENHIREYNEFTAAQLTKVEVTFVKNWGPFSYIFDEPYMFNEIDWNYINDPGAEKFKLLENTVALYSHKHKYFLDYFIEFQGKAKLIIKDIETELGSRK